MGCSVGLKYMPKMLWQPWTPLRELTIPQTSYSRADGMGAKVSCPQTMDKKIKKLPCYA